MILALILFGIVQTASASAASSSILLVDNVPVRSCGAAWTTDLRWTATSCVIFANGFDKP